MSKNIEKRLERIEGKLNVGKEPIIIEIVEFGDGELPPEQVVGGITVRHIRYSDKIRQNETERNNKPKCSQTNGQTG
jgi:hypothetical protein